MTTRGKRRCLRRGDEADEGGEGGRRGVEDGVDEGEFRILESSRRRRHLWKKIRDGIGKKLEMGEGEYMIKEGIRALTYGERRRDVGHEHVVVPFHTSE